MTAIAKFFWTVIGLSSFAYIGFFAIANNAQISVTLLPQTAPVTAPLWLFLLISFAIGIFVISLIASVRLSALRLKTHRLEKKLQKAQAKQADHDADALALSESA